MMIRHSGSYLVILLLLLALARWADFADAGEAQDQTAAKSLRAGIIGLDTSHVVAFTQLLNDPHAKAELAGVRIVAAYPGGSPDIPSSRDRVAGFTRDLRARY